MYCALDDVASLRNSNHYTVVGLSVLSFVAGIKVLGLYSHCSAVDWTLTRLRALSNRQVIRKFQYYLII